MFGYVNVNRQKLSEEDKRIYQSYYCGLCQTLRRHFGKRGQLLLNYDMVFLVVLLTGLYEPQEEVRDSFTCKLHPIKKKTLRRNEILDYAAYMNVILAFHNLMDDYNDEKNPAKKRLAMLLAKDYAKAKDLYPRQAAAVEKCMQLLAERERARDTNIEAVAGLTGDMLGEIFAMRQDEWYDELKQLGYYLGKFIYLMDAYEDIQKDKKKGSYNPLLPLQEDGSQDFELITHLMMTSIMSQCACSFERLPILLHADILRNIIYSGVWMRYDYIQVRKEKDKNNKRKTR